MIVRIGSALGALIVASTAAAMSVGPAGAETMMFQCGEPKGKRVDYGDLFDLEGKHLQKFSDGPQWSEDGFAGVRPVVVIEGGTMLISWSNAAPPNLRGQIDPGKRVYRIPITGNDDISVWGTSGSSAVGSGIMA
jgi:hypothetical protein